ncbi:hypothetical protein [Sorangium sp. So ce1099]|uniref:hypothetical protein n=1 Tax=Sorangium sp. So ce1099 TaxID=3133331 RepID=UPI003F644578
MGPWQRFVERFIERLVERFIERLVHWGQPLPSFEDIRQMNIQAAATLTRERVISALERTRFSCDEARDELLRLARSCPFDAAMYARCRALAGLDRPQYGPPGAIEETWYLEGLIERLRSLGEAERG